HSLTTFRPPGRNVTPRNCNRSRCASHHWPNGCISNLKPPLPSSSSIDTDRLEYRNRKLSLVWYTIINRLRSLADGSQLAITLFPPTLSITACCSFIAAKASFHLDTRSFDKGFVIGITAGNLTFCCASSGSGSGFAFGLPETLGAASICGP